MKKEYAILIVLILILGAYLFLYPENRDYYTLPEVPTIDLQSVTGLVVEKDQARIRFSKTGTAWTVTDKEYPADEQMVTAILDIFKHLTLTTLVSQKEDLHRYALDDSQKISVKLLADETGVFELGIGKTAATFNHTFVMLPDDRNVYHAAGSLRPSVDKTVEQFRDKTVLSFAAPSIKKLFISKGGITRTLVAASQKNNAGKDPVWTSDDNSPADSKTIQELLTTLGVLSCESYSNPAAGTLDQSQNPLITLRLENDTTHELTLYQDQPETDIYGTSSLNPYLFVLSSFDGKQILTHTDKLLGIHTPEE